jgi:hypothetical protein
MLKRIAILAGSALVAIVTAASFAIPANASATGSNGAVYGTISGPACEWNLSAHAKSSFYGHLEIVEVVRTGIETTRTTVFYNSPNKQNPSFSNKIGCSSSDTQICVNGWRLNPNRSYTKVGEPCFVVYNK